MARSERPYSRVYHDAPADDKFADIWWDDDAALATWLRLLVAADQSYPNPATYYEGVDREAVKRLVDAGLVDPVGKRTYRIHGLANEREKRTALAREAATARHAQSGSSAAAERTQSGPPARTSSSSSSSSRRVAVAEGMPAAPADPDDDVLDAWFRLTASAPKPTVVKWLTDLAAEHGARAVASMLADEWMNDSDRTTLLTRTKNRLWQSDHEAEKARQKRAAEAAAAEKARVDTMSPEQRAANLQRLGDMLAEKGLVPHGKRRGE